MREADFWPIADRILDHQLDGYSSTFSFSSLYARFNGNADLEVNTVPVSLYMAGLIAHKQGVRGYRGKVITATADEADENFTVYNVKHFHDDEYGVAAPDVRIRVGRRAAGFRVLPSGKPLMAVERPLWLATKVPARQSYIGDAVLATNLLLYKDGNWVPV